MTDDLQDLLRDLLAAAPGVRDALADDGELTPDAEIPVLWLAAVGRALAATLPALKDTERIAAFAVVERYVASGSEPMRTAVCTGLLEALAGQVSKRRLDGAELATLLGPRSRAYVDAYDQFTLGRSSLGGRAAGPA